MKSNRDAAADAFMTFSGGKVVDGTAFYDSIVFNELWEGITPLT